MEVLVIEPGHGSYWLVSAEYVEIAGKQYVRGLAWDSSQAGSSLLPDDYRGEYELMTCPVSLILKVV